MAHEIIGNFGEGQLPDDRDSILAQQEFAITYLKLVCGNPPAGYELGVVWQDHDSGSYPGIGLRWDGPYQADWDYLNRCQIVLEALTGAWFDLNPAAMQERFEEGREAEDN